MADPNQPSTPPTGGAPPARMTPPQAQQAAAAQQQAADIINLLRNVAASQPPTPTTTTIPTPKMGNVSNIPGTGMVAWTGGKPNRRWTGLAASAATEPAGPCQYRSLSISTSQKGQHYRIAGLDPKFQRTDDLESLQVKLMDHYKIHGMDSVTYVPDPVDQTEMICCVYPPSSPVVGQGQGGHPPPSPHVRPVRPVQRHGRRSVPHEQPG